MSQTPETQDTRTYATGRRKDAVARLWLSPGSGKITINGKNCPDYFRRPVLQMIVNQPFLAAEADGQFNIFCSVKGGGLSGQAGAVRHALSRALSQSRPDLRPPIKAQGFLTRDARVVERKKYGRKKARKSFQFSKR